MRGGWRLNGVLAAVAAAIVAVVPDTTQAQSGTFAPSSPRCRNLTEAGERLRCYDEDATFSAAAVILKELECERPPRPAETLKLLISRNAITSFAFDVADSMNYFLLQRPEVIDGLTIVGVFGFDETGAFSFVRGNGTSPGRVFGVVTQDGLAKIDRWRLSHSPGLMFDATASNLKSGKDLACWK